MVLTPWLYFRRPIATYFSISSSPTSYSPTSFRASSGDASYLPVSIRLALEPGYPRLFAACSAVSSDASHRKRKAELSRLSRIGL